MYISRSIILVSVSELFLEQETDTCPDVSMYIQPCVCMYVCMYVCVCVCVCMYMYVCTYMCACSHVRMYARIYLCIYVCVHVAMYKYIRAHIHDMYVRMCACSRT